MFNVSNKINWVGTRYPGELEEIYSDYVSRTLRQRNIYWGHIRVRSSCLYAVKINLEIFSNLGAKFDMYPVNKNHFDVFCIDNLAHIDYLFVDIEPSFREFVIAFIPNKKHALVYKLKYGI